VFVSKVSFENSSHDFGSVKNKKQIDWPMLSVKEERENVILRSTNARRRFLQEMINWLIFLKDK
jgi:predicted AAA+ superfamily ATPase